MRKHAFILVLVSFLCNGTLFSQALMNLSKFQFNSKDDRLVLNEHMKVLKLYEPFTLEFWSYATSLPSSRVTLFSHCVGGKGPFSFLVGGEGRGIWAGYEKISNVWHFRVYRGFYHSYLTSHLYKDGSIIDFETPMFDLVIDAFNEDREILNHWVHWSLSYNQSTGNMTVDFNGVKQKSVILDDKNFRYISSSSHNGMTRSLFFAPPASKEYLFSYFDKTDNTDIVIGNYKFPSYPNDLDYYFAGYISQIRLWNTDFENNRSVLNSLYNKGVDKSHSNLVYLIKNSVDLMAHKVALNSVDTVSALTLPVKPAPVIDLHAKDSCNAIVLSWKPVEGSEVVIKRTPDTATIRTTNKRWIDFPPKAEVKYVYSVQSTWGYLPAGPGTTSMKLHSDTVTVAGKRQDSNPPTKFIATPDCEGNIVLDWDIKIGAINYELEFGEPSAFQNGTQTKRSMGLDMTYTHTPNKPDQKFIYRLYVQNDKCTGYVNKEINAAAKENCYTAPTNVRTIVKVDTIQVAWDYAHDRGSKPNKFQILRKAGESGEYKALGTATGELTRVYNDLEAKSCVNYYYRVQALSSCGGSTASISESSTVVKKIEPFEGVFHASNDAYFSASKGYFGNRVALEWKVNPNKKADIHSFEISRRESVEATPILIQVINGNSFTTWNDMSAEANKLYIYTICAIGDCEGSRRISDSTSTIGFRLKTGIVSGKVTFEGGNSVQNAEVRASKGLAKTSCLDFSITNSCASVDYANTLRPDSSLTFEAWVHSSQWNHVNGTQMILSMDSTSCLYLRENEVVCEVKTDDQVTHIAEHEYDFDSNEGWHHLAYTFGDDSLRLFIDGRVVASVFAHSVGKRLQYLSGKKVTIGSANSSLEHPFKGKLDEVRLWNRCKSTDQIGYDYRRTSSPDEVGLMAYWRMDENMGDFIYDCSIKDGVYHKNHAALYGNPQWSLLTPSYEQLHPAALTDSYGNYTITNIPYTDNGEIISITPVKGVHRFDPPMRTLYVGDNSPVHNNIDYLDKSAFTFNGKVNYKGTNFPVKDANVYIDDNQVIGAGKVPVATDENGEFAIHVPIGEHFITVKKTGHRFEHSGQWPHPTSNDPYATFNFEENLVQPIPFNDVTRVIVAGRFVGGNVEGNKVLGFDKSINNIGVGTITLSNAAGYDIDTTEKAGPSMTFATSDVSGEYLVQLLPEKYTIKDVKNEQIQMSANDLGILDLTSIPELTTVNDTIYKTDALGRPTSIVKQVLTQHYHVERSFIYYAVPTIQVYGKDNYPFYGEDSLKITNPVTNRDTILHLSGSNKPFNYDVFRMASFYPIKIFLYEIYTNTSKNRVDQVPVEGAEVTITNNLEYNPVAHVLKTDVNGCVSDYQRFQAGVPNMSTDVLNKTSFTKTMGITAKTANHEVSWPDAGVYRAYVLGAVDAGGTNFVSYGPESPAIVLHDPPGSNSYAYLSKGSEFMVKQSCSFSQTSQSSYDNLISMGINVQIGGGLAGPVFQTEKISDIRLGIEVQSFASNDGGYMEKWSFKEDFKTSAYSNGVGSMADVYIGRSNNMYFSETKNIQILPKEFCISKGFDKLADSELPMEGLFTLGIRPGFAASPVQDNTLFVYSQEHIVNNLIPELTKLKYNLLAGPDYESKVPYDDVAYGLSNTHPIWKERHDTSAHPSYIYKAVSGIDSVEMLNEQIGIWVQTIALNEATKAKANYDENVSFDGLAGSYQREATMTSTVYDGKTYQKSFKVFGGGTDGFLANKTGLCISSVSSMNFDQQIALNKEDTKKMTWGYVLDDSDEGDYYSVGIAHNEYMRRLELDNFTSSNDNLEDKIEKLNSITGYVGLGSSAGVLLATKLAAKKFPLKAGYVGALIGMGITSALQGVSMGYFGSYMNDIEGEDHKSFLNPLIHSPIFRIKGGQSRCPYEGPEYSMLYSSSKTTKDPALIHVGTQQHEMPEINVEPSQRINVPETSKAEFTLKLTNASPTGKALTYVMSLDESSNANGAILGIDGMNPINRVFFIEAGQTLTKTLTVEKGSKDIMNYDNLRLILHSSCQFDPVDHLPEIADTVSFSVHFLPTCSNVELEPQENWVVNTESKDSLNVVFSEYNLNSSTFQRIVFEYRIPGGTPVSVISFFKDAMDTIGFSGPKELINNRSSINWIFPMESLNDGIYEIRAKTICKGDFEFVTPWYVGTLDGVRPRVFGEPKPSSGVLGIGDELSVQFNEPIHSGYLYAHKDLISVKAILNNTDLKKHEYLVHDASIHFDGQKQHMAIRDGVNLKYSSFTLEFWAKRERTGKECLLSQDNSQKGGLWVGFDEGNHFVMTLNGQTVKSDNVYNTINQWSHYACIFNNGTSTEEKGITLIILSDASTEEKYQKVSNGYFVDGPFMVAYCEDDQSAFKGNMHDLRIWKNYRTMTDISTNMYLLFTGFEKGLCALWPMDDVKGRLARDIVFGKNATVNATWQVSRDGQALALNGGYSTFSTSGMAFTKETDFSLECWFKGAAKTDTIYLLSGDLSTPTGWGLGANANGALFIQNGAKVVSFKNASCMDNNWHHVAVTVNRRSDINLYLDGMLVQSIVSTGFEGFGTDQCALGARYRKLPAGDTFDKYFDGVLDEVRIWNTSKDIKLINRYMNRSLRGDDQGLKAYFPFEDVTNDDPSKSDATRLNLTSDTIGVAGSIDMKLLSNFTNETPLLKLHAPLTEVTFDYVINGDKVIITPNIDASMLENANLEVSINGVKDLNNNVMASTISWSAFVNKNNLLWDQEEMFIDKLIGTPYEFKRVLSNVGGKSQEWSLFNLPLWLDATPDHGTIEPMQKLQIDFSLNPAINTGDYSHDVYAATLNGASERMAIHLKVKAADPQWIVDAEKFEGSMSLVGKLMIDGHYSTDVNDVVGAFVGDECRGVAHLTYLKDLDDYILFLDVFGNINDEEVKLRIWDASEATVYVDITPKLSFISNDVVGSLRSPVQISSTGIVNASYVLVNGWKWLSFNLNSTKLNQTNNLMLGINATTGDVIKGQESYDLFSEGLGWMGTLSNTGGIRNDEMYMFKSSKDAVLQYSGEPVPTTSTPITLKNGWNWIGYTPQQRIPINDALGYLQPEQDDIIKSQYKFALFDNAYGWYGGLTFLEPGLGYKYKANNIGTGLTKSFTYPKESMLRSASSSNENWNMKDFSPEKWKENMSLVASVKTTEGVSVTNKLLLAYRMNELVGAAKPTQLPNAQEPIYFLSIYGEGKTEELIFKIADFNGENQIILNEMLPFVSDAVHGTLNNPYSLSVEGKLLVAGNRMECYPNPFKTTVQIFLKSNLKMVEMEVCDLTGKVVRKLPLENNGSTWDGLVTGGAKAPEGIYFLNAYAEDGTTYHTKLVKK